MRSLKAFPGLQSDLKVFRGFQEGSRDIRRASEKYKGVSNIFSEVTGCQKVLVQLKTKIYVSLKGIF